MSIGARGIDILSQFLIEAVIISVSGGVIGIMLGIIASWLVNAIAHWPVYIQAYSVVLSFAVCTVTGVFFGWYPAKKAAGLLKPFGTNRFLGRFIMWRGCSVFRFNLF